MKTFLLKSALFTAFLFCILHCSAQKQNTRIAYEYVMNDSGSEKKEMKLIEVKKESYNEEQPYNGSNILPSAINNTIPSRQNQTVKDEKYTYQYTFEKKYATVKKIDTYSKDLVSVTNIYFGFNNRLSDEIVVDEKTKHKEIKRFLYDRKGRLAKIVSYKNGKVNGYTLYEYNNEVPDEDYTNL